MTKYIYSILISFLMVFAFVGCSDQQSAQGVSDNEIVLGMHTDISGPVFIIWKVFCRGCSNENKGN